MTKKTITQTSLLAGALLMAGLSGCGSDSGNNSVEWQQKTVAPYDKGACDPTDNSHCLLPFPNDYFAQHSAATDSGLQINFDDENFLVSTATEDGAVFLKGKYPLPGHPAEKVSTAEFNRNDGFSPGSMMITQVPGVDIVKTGAVPLNDMERYLDEDAPIVVINASTGERHMIWAELDSNAVDTEGNIVADKQALIIRPGKNFIAGQRYIVALRNMKDSSGETIEASAGFRIYRDDETSQDAQINARRDAMEDMFSQLTSIGIDRVDLFLAWDFTVASTRNLTERMLHIRDDALTSLGGQSPAFTIDEVQYIADAGRDEWARKIKGTITYPNYLNSVNGDSGSHFHYEEGADLPSRMNGDNTITQPFSCFIPQGAIDKVKTDGNADGVRPFFYGHGLLGSRRQADKSIYSKIGGEFGGITCAVNWLGMESADVMFVSTQALPEISKFQAVADRSQQGFLGWIMLAEALLRDGGFMTHEAFQLKDGSALDGNALYNPEKAYYDGDSQGGILGGALMAVAPNIESGVMGVPGMNYSLLLRRSVDYMGAFSDITAAAYPDLLERNLVFALMQMIWDRGETNGYAAHVGGQDPLPGARGGRVLLHVGLGDHQVTPISAEIWARTANIPMHKPGAIDGRHYAVDPYYAIEEITYPHTGSAMVVWDGGGPGNESAACAETKRCDAVLGTKTIPLTNTPPIRDQGMDPHEAPRRQPLGSLQKARFWFDGTLENVCKDMAQGACLMWDWDGVIREE